MKCATPQIVTPHRTIEWCDEHGHESTVMQVPCGKCIPCLSNKRQDWIFRLKQEHKHSTSSVFVTLTFDRKHYPSDGSLDKRHIQLFMKRLRKRDGSNKIRYYAVGEYGTESGRAHYHLLLFNLNNIEHVRTSWTDSTGAPIGIVHVGTVTHASVGYITKYIVQPMQPVDGRVKPFATMSRKYGLGGKYLTDEMVQWHKADDRAFAFDRSVKVRLPRFYRSKIWYHAKDRERVSSKLGAQAKIQQDKEEAYWKKAHGQAWQNKRAEAQIEAYARVKTKIKYSQTL